MNQKIIKSIMLIGFFVNTYLCAMEQLSSNLSQLTQQLKTLQEMLNQLPGIQPPPPSTEDSNIKKLIKNNREIATIDITEDDPIWQISLKDIIDAQLTPTETIIAYVNDEVIQAHAFLKSLFGDNYLNVDPQQYRDINGNLQKKRPPHYTYWSDELARTPGNRQLIGNQSIEFYTIENIDDPTFEYIGNDKELYGYGATPKNDALVEIFKAYRPQGM